jgi:hypothetical protein
MSDALRTAVATAFAVYPTATLSRETLALWVRLLSRIPIDDVVRALEAHVMTSRFPPTVAEIVERVQAQDGRPGAEEAWSACSVLADERASVVWTDEMAAAWWVAAPIAGAGDLVAGRKAFTEAYVREVAAARAAGRAARWTPTLGIDAGGRVRALEEAVQRKRLSVEQVARITPPAPATAVPLLESAQASPLTPERRAQLRAIVGRRDA